MAGSLRRLTRPEVLAEIEPSRLLRLLQGYVDYFLGQEFPLPDSPDSLDLDGLAKILQDAARQAPEELIGALFLIDQLATGSGIDAVRRAAAALGVELLAGDERSAADVAVEAWLANPAVLTRAEASRLSVRSRSLRIFIMAPEAELVGMPETGSSVADVIRAAAAAETIAHAKKTLNDQLDGLGAVVAILPFPTAVGVKYVVQRGGVFERHGAVEGGKRASVGYVPLSFDVVAFDATRRELSVKREPVGEQAALRAAFGVALTGDAGAFDRAATIDLEPVRSAGPLCLWTRDVPGIQSVTLTKAMMRMQPGLDHVREESATDLYRAWESRGHGIPPGEIVKAQFEFEFDDSPNSRKVTLTSGATIRLTRDDDAELIDTWMRQRSFVVRSGSATVAGANFWGWLEQPDEAIATEADWRKRLGDQYEAASIHMSDAAAVTSKIRLDGETADRRVLPDGQRGYQAVCELTGDSQDVDPLMLSLRRLEALSVGRAMAQAMRLRETVAPVEDCTNAFSLGRYAARGDETWQVCFVAAADAASLRAACLTLWGVYKKPFILVTPTRRHGTPDLADAIGVVARGWIALSECATLDAAGAIALTGDLQTRLMPFLQVVMPHAFGASSRPQFPTPPESKWSDVTIKFLDPERVSVKVGSASGTYTYDGMGMADGRSKNMSEQWRLLQELAKEYGAMTWKSRGASRKNQKRRERLSKDLRSFFGIDGDPIIRETDPKGWRTRFTLEPD